MQRIAKREKLITASTFSPFFYAFYVSFFLWNNFELTTEGRTVRWMSDNDFTLFIF
ncbi:colicin immunity protein Cui [Escherichia coli]